MGNAASDRPTGVESVFGMMTRIAYPVEVNGNERNINLISHDKTLLDTFRKSIISGDIIKTDNQEVEIVCIASEGVGSISGAATVVCLEQTFTRLSGEDGYTTVSVVLVSASCFDC